MEVRGRVDSTNADEPGDILTREIEGGRAQIVLDLANGEYMSSAGLREIGTALKRAKRGLGGDVRIAQPPFRVREALEIIGLDRVFSMYASVDEAASALASPPS